ncbi:MAG: xylulokinase, partial [bacterium]|nr:xylulokinase [bacterium]
VSLGTSGVLFAANDAYLPNPDSAVHAFCHALPDRWHQMGVILSATDALNWFAGIAGCSAGELSDKLGLNLKAPNGVTFLPYLSGERTPHNDASIRGVFSFICHANDQSDLTQAVMEGVGFAFRDCQKALQTAGTTIDRATAVGGGANSRYWLKAIATILNIPIDIPEDGDFGAAFGAARLGMLAAENLEPSTVCTMPKIADTVEPEKNLTAAFDQAYEKYTRLYPTMKGL